MSTPTNDGPKKLTLRQLEKAASIYAMAMVAHCDSIGAEDEVEESVMETAISKARHRLISRGIDPCEAKDIRDCIQIARNQTTK